MNIVLKEVKKTGVKVKLSYGERKRERGRGRGRGGAGGRAPQSWIKDSI